MGSTEVTTGFRQNIKTQCFKERPPYQHCTSSDSLGYDIDSACWGSNSVNYVFWSHQAVACMLILDVCLESVNSILTCKYICNRFHLA